MKYKSNSSPCHFDWLSLAKEQLEVSQADCQGGERLRAKREDGSVGHWSPAKEDIVWPVTDRNPHKIVLLHSGEMPWFSVKSKFDILFPFVLDISISFKKSMSNKKTISLAIITIQYAARCKIMLTGHNKSSSKN